MTGNLNIYLFSKWLTSINFEAGRGAEAQSVTVKPMVVGSIATRGSEIFIYIYIFIYSLWCRGKVRRWVLLFNGERSVLTLGSLCLPCCVRNTAWSWLTIILYKSSLFDFLGNVKKSHIKQKKCKYINELYICMSDL